MYCSLNFSTCNYFRICRFWLGLVGLRLQCCSSFTPGSWLVLSLPGPCSFPAPCTFSSQFYTDWIWYQSSVSAQNRTVVYSTPSSAPRPPTLSCSLHPPAAYVTSVFTSSLPQQQCICSYSPAALLAPLMLNQNAMCWNSAALIGLKPMGSQSACNNGPQISHFSQDV